MPKKLKLADNPEFDPTLPSVPLELAGDTYTLCFDFAALALAERLLRKAGQDVNMLAAMDLRALGADRLPIVFFAGLLRAHPEMTFDQARGLITIANFSSVYGAVIDAYVKACLPKEEKQPDPPVEAVAE